MNKFIPTLCFFSILLLSAFTEHNPTELLPTKVTSCEISFSDDESAAAANCCGTINIPQPICGGTIIFNFTLQSVNGGPVTNLSVGDNYVEVDKGGKYIIAYTTIDTGAPSACLPIQATWTLCGTSGSAILNPTAKAVAGKGNVPCLGL